MDNIYLLGAEDVRHAATNIKSAAEDIKNAINQYEFLTERLIRTLEDHATRLEDLYKEQKP